MKNIFQNIILITVLFLPINKSLAEEYIKVPNIFSITPASIHLGDQVEIIGENFGASAPAACPPPADNPAAPPCGVLDGEGKSQKIVSWSDTKVVAIIDNISELSRHPGDMRTINLKFHHFLNVSDKTAMTAKSGQIEILAPIVKTYQQPQQKTPVSSPSYQQPTQPSCSEDTWSCGDWGSCSPGGIQMRSCKRTYDCSSVETQSPATSQYCQAPKQFNDSPSPAINPAQNYGDNVNRDQIFRATVKLRCPMPDKKYYSQGSGTIIDQYGTILTNRHVILGTIGSCYVGFINSEDDIPSYDEVADVKNIPYDSSSNSDFALLKIRNPSYKKFIAVDIFKGNSSLLKSGIDTILPFGYPNEDLFGLTITATEGPYIGKGTTLTLTTNNCPKLDRNTTLNVSQFFKTTATIDHGNSGGGAYQKKTGYFIGIPTLGTSCNPEIPSRVNYILSINTIKNWLNSLGGYNVSQNNYTNTGNYFNSPIAIEELNMSDLRAIDYNDTTVSIYNDKKKKTLLVDIDGWFSSRTPTFLINGDQGQGYYVYFGTDKKANPVKKGTFIRNTEYSPTPIKRNGEYYFIFRTKDSKGNIGDPMVVEYRYKK